MYSLPFGTYGFDIAIATMSVMVAIGGIVLGLGYATNSRKLKDFGKDELMQSAINGMLVVGLLAFFAPQGIVSVAINSIVSSSGLQLHCERFMTTNPAICLAYDYLAGSGYSMNGAFHESILAQATQMITGLLSLNTVLGIVASLKLDVWIVTVSFGYVLAPILDQVQNLVTVFSTIAVGSVVQSSILIFSSICSTTIILPLGLVLRTFYPTRRIAGFLIALAIGLYAVLPLSYVLDAAIASSYYVSVNSTGVDQLALSSQHLESDILGINTSRSTGATVSGYISKQLGSISSQFSSLANSLINMVSFLIVYTFVLPAFSLLITSISVRELSALLGSELHFDLFKIM